MFKPKSCGAKKQSGYTFIEVLIALFVFIMVMFIVSVGFIQILKNGTSLRASQDRVNRLQLMLSIISFDLAQAVITFEGNSTARMRGAFYADQRRLHFIKTGNINPNDQFDYSSLEVIEYLVEGNTLVRLSKNSNETTYKKLLLWQGVSGIRWQFIDSLNRQYDIWPPTQDWAYKNPRVVKIIMQLADFGPIEKVVELASYE